MDRIRDKTVAKTLIAGAMVWGLLVLALIVFPWVVGPSLADDGSGPEAPSAARRIDRPSLPPWVEALLEEGASRTQDSDLSIVKSAETGSGDPGVVFNGERITYSLTVSNPASVGASDLLILDVLPEDTLTDIWCSDDCSRVVERRRSPAPWATSAVPSWLALTWRQPWTTLAR